MASEKKDCTMTIRLSSRTRGWIQDLAELLSNEIGTAQSSTSAIEIAVYEALQRRNYKEDKGV